MPTVRENGFEGDLYTGDGTKDKVMIVMSGSNGGMGITRREALFYHKNGIPSLALALFKTKQTEMFMEEKELRIIRFNRDKKVTPETIIPVENIKTPILLLSSKR